MNREEYFKHRKDIRLYTLIITCVVLGTIIKSSQWISLSEKADKLISALLYIISYWLLLYAVSRLKAHEIHGMHAIVWSSFILYGLSLSDISKLGIAFLILRFLTISGCLFFLVDGTIRFVLSVIYKLKKTNGKSDGTAEAVEIVMAVVASLTAIIVSVLSLL